MDLPNQYDIGRTKKVFGIPNQVIACSRDGPYPARGKKLNGRFGSVAVARNSSAWPAAYGRKLPALKSTKGPDLGGAPRVHIINPFSLSISLQGDS